MNNVKDFINNWNYKYPVDYWWRRKHKIAFNSSEHRACNFWDQLFEYYEDILYKKLGEEFDYELNSNDYLKIREVDGVDLDSNITKALKELAKFKEEYGD